MFSRTFLLDAAERVFWTYVQAFLGLLLVSGVTRPSPVTTKPDPYVCCICGRAWPVVSLARDCERRCAG